MRGERFKVGLRILGMGVLILALAGCAPKQTTPPNPTDENGAGGNNLSLPGTDVPPSPLADSESVETPTLAPEEKTPTAAEHSQPAAIPVESPSVGSLEFTGAPYSMELSPSEITDLNAADAVYAYFLSTGRKWTPSSDEAFIAGMSEWAKELGKLDIRVIRAANNYGVATMLVKGAGDIQQVLLDFFDDSGALRSATPGGWSKESTSRWVDVNGEVGLVIGPDGVGYVTQMDGDDVVGYLNPYQASLDNIEHQWIPVDEKGNPTQVWNGEEWVKVAPEVAWWTDIPRDTDLTPGSEMVKMLDGLNLRPSYTFSDSSSDKPGLEGKVAVIGKTVYISGFEDVPFSYDGISGDQFRIFGIAKNPDGTYSEVSYLLAVDFHGAKNGFGRTSTDGLRYDALFRNADGTHKPILYHDMVEYYKSLVGAKVSLIIPVWDNKVTFDPKLFAWSVFPNFGLQYNVKPGEAYYPFDNGLYDFAEYVCAWPDFECNQTHDDNPTRSYGDPRLLLEMAKKSPWGLFVSNISEE